MKGYKLSFGDLPEGTIYFDPWHKIDLRSELKARLEEMPKAELEKLLVGDITWPVFVEPDFIDISAKRTPVLELIPRRTVRGKSVDYNRITAKAAAAWGGETDAPTYSADTYQSVSKSIKYLRIRGKVSGPAIAVASRSGFINAYQHEVIIKTQALMEKLEETIMTGDTTQDANAFNGLITEAKASGQTSNKAGASLALSDIDNLLADLEKQGASPDVAICGPRAFAQVKALLQANQRFVNVTEIQGGIVALEYAGIPFVSSRFVPDNAYDATNNPDGRMILFVDMDYVWLGVLQDVTVEELGKTSDAVEFLVKWYGTLVDQAPEYLGLIYGLP